jgi:hypothetical protein
MSSQAGVIGAWQEFSAHAAHCKACRSAELAIARYPRSDSIGSAWERCCEVGRPLLRAWHEECVELESTLGRRSVQLPLVPAQEPR